jgi:site-specific recombinase XerD
LELRRRQVVDRVDDLIEAFIAEHLSTIRSGAAVARQLRREVAPLWGSRSVHDIKRRDISALVFEAAVQRTPYSAHRLLKGLKRFFSWCLGRAILESSPALSIQSPLKQISRDRVLSDEELTRVLSAARRACCWHLRGERSHDSQRICGWAAATRDCRMTTLVGVPGDGVPVVDC